MVLHSSSTVLALLFSSTRCSTRSVDSRDRSDVLTAPAPENRHSEGMDVGEKESSFMARGIISDSSGCCEFHQASGFRSDDPRPLLEANVSTCLAAACSTIRGSRYSPRGGERNKLAADDSFARNDVRGVHLARFAGCSGAGNSS